MQKIQEQQFNMFVVVDRFSDTITQEMKDRMPQFEFISGLFKQVVKDIRRAIGIQSMDRTGYWQWKTELRESLTVFGVDIATKTQSFAIDTENPVLFNEINFSKTSLSHSSDVSFEAATNIILGKANANATALVPYEVTAAMLLDYANKAELYQEAMPTPQIGIDTRKAATTVLRLSILQGNGYLENMDRKIKSMQAAEPVFCEAYFTARFIGRPGFHTLSARGQVKDASCNPVALVRISCLKLGLKRRASKLGRFKFRNLPEGRHEFRFERVGYGTVVVLVNIFLGIRAEVVVVMDVL